MIVYYSAMVSGIIVLIVLLMYGHTSKNIAAMVRHCKVALHPHGMRLLLINLLVFVVLSQRVVEMLSVLLSPELSI